MQEDPSTPEKYEEPQESDLPDKPPIKDQMPSDAELEQEEEPGELDISDEEFLDRKVARDDHSIDDEEDDAGETA